jgi:hypothetical protein
MSKRDEDAKKTKAVKSDGDKRREAGQQVAVDNAQRRAAEKAAAVPVKDRKN